MQPDLDGQVRYRHPKFWRKAGKENLVEPLQYLFKSLDRRYRPEDVADVITQALDQSLSRSEKAVLKKAAGRSLRLSFFKYTSMLQDFYRPVGMEKQVETARSIFETAANFPDVAGNDPEVVANFIRILSQEIHKSVSANDYMHDRLNREARKTAGLDISRRRYNKLFRHLARMEQKLQTYLSEIKKLQLTKVGKSGLASRLEWDAFSSDVNTACFVAYLTARSNLRSEFTIFGQKRAFDEIAAMLFRRCERSQTTNWWVIAHVFPRNDVLTNLTDEQKGVLLGKWFTILEELSAILQAIWQRSEFNRETMIVRRGNDSTTWNTMAGAWNKARDNWIALVYALGMESILQALCFGKVMRLMAADVAWWHRRAGGDVDPNTLVWRELPLPWEVLSGDATCTLPMVVEVCRKHNVDPKKSGWVAPRPRTKVGTYRPTPELVHGVSIANPFLAKFLRDSGFFSGKHLRRKALPEDVRTHYDALQDHHKRLVDENNDTQ